MSNSAATQYPRNALFAALLSAFSFGSCQAAELVVTSLGDDGGSCPGANCTLRAALATVEFGDVITFDPSFAYPAVITLTSGELLVNRDAIVEGPGADKLTVSANDLSRAMTVDAGASVKLSGLTIAHGYVRGEDGADSSTTGSWALHGESAAGGCVYISAMALLRLEQVAIHHCFAWSGDGGSGGANADGLLPRAGNAGDVEGGAIYVAGRLETEQTSVSGVTTIGGDGGDGGMLSGKFPPDTQFDLNGGDGGSIRGGAIFVGDGSNASLEMINSSILDVNAQAGAGGAGVTNESPTVFDAGNGGSGGWIQGNILANEGAQIGLAFSTLRAGLSAPGIGGPAGSGPFVDGLEGPQGVISGEVLHSVVSFISTIMNTALLGRINDAEDNCAPFAPDTQGFNFSDDSSCNATHISPITGSFPVDTRRRHGLDELAPLPTSVVIDAVTDCVNLDDAPVTTDQAGRVRPFDGDGVGGAQCDIGAVEFDNDAIFTNGFDSG